MDLAPSPLSDWAFGVVGRFDRLRERWWQRVLGAGTRVASGRLHLYRWWSQGGKLLVVTGTVVLVLVGVTTWALLDWTAPGTAKRLSLDESATADAGIAVAELREFESERKREEARALRPITPERGAEPVAQADEERRRQVELEATRRVDEERRRQVELEATRRADEERRRQAEREATRRAEEERRRQAELEATRRTEDERRRQAELEATSRTEDERRRQAELEATRRAEDERRRQAELEATRRAEEERRRLAEVEAARVRAEAARQIARPVEPAPVKPALSPAELTRIRTQVEQKLQSRGLFRVSTADRWGVAPEMGSQGEVSLSGTLRDMELYNEAIRLVREVPGVQAVRATNVRVADMGIATVEQGDSARIRGEIQQRLRSRGLLRESSADRWGVTVEVGASGEVTLAGMVRDAGLRGEAIRLAQSVQGVQQVKQEIRVMEGTGRP